MTREEKPSMLGSMQWELQHTEVVTNDEELKALLLERVPLEERALFLHPLHPHLLTPEETGVSAEELLKAKALIETAIAEKKTIVIFGDYDCDGVTATAILWEALRARGVMARPFLPHREKHGYGLSIKSLEDVFLEGKPDLLITVDNGIVANEAFAWLREQGVQTILTDHHIAGQVLPEADAIIHSTKLSGATVSWLLAHALSPETSDQLLDLAILGMIADQVPVTGPGRSFAVFGMEALRQTKRPSLISLAELAGVKLAQANVGTIHYGLAPRINAMGRLRHALDSLRALLSRNTERVELLMNELQTVNEERQKLTLEAVTDLQEKLDSDTTCGVQVVIGDYAEGIIGLLASKVVELTGKPALVGSSRGEVAKFSCRSVSGIDITVFLRSLSDVTFLSLGGHAMAAGFSLDKKTLDDSIKNIRAQAKLELFPQIKPPVIAVFAPIHLSSVGESIVSILEMFGPFGSSSPEPRFLLQDFTVNKVQTLGKDGKHHKFFLEDKQTGKEGTVVMFQTEKRVSVPLEDIEQMVIRLERSRYKPERRAIEVMAEWAK